MRAQATILIAARNADATIQRALLSAMAQGNYPIILVDDFSTDDTVCRAREIAGSRLQVVRPYAHQTLGLTRQTGLLALQTPYAVWLDADDELLPGRVERMVAALDLGPADLASDEIELRDGLQGAFREVLRIPAFLKASRPLARLFERNYLAGIGVVGFRTDFARRIGYDSALHGAEDIDFVLRAIAAGARFSLLESAGYRLYAYPNSISRQTVNQRRMYRAGLLKHDYENIQMLYSQAGQSDRITAWGLASVAIFREEYARAQEFISLAESMMTNPNELLEPGGPCPAPEGWRVYFHKGTVLLLIGRPAEALPLLEAAERAQPTAEGANNLGVAKARSGKLREASVLFEQARERFPDFLDAKMNLQSPNPGRVTTHPLRNWASRQVRDTCQPARTGWASPRTQFEKSCQK